MTGAGCFQGASLKELKDDGCSFNLSGSIAHFLESTE